MDSSDEVMDVHLISHICNRLVSILEYLLCVCVIFGDTLEIYSDIVIYIYYIYSDIYVLDTLSVRLY